MCNNVMDLLIISHKYKKSARDFSVLIFYISQKSPPPSIFIFLILPPSGVPSPTNAVGAGCEVCKKSFLTFRVTIYPKHRALKRRAVCIYFFNVGAGISS